MADSSGRWTNEEHERFMQGLDLYGKKWTKVAEVVGTRSTVQVSASCEMILALFAIASLPPLALS